jgi:zinc protease
MRYPVFDSGQLELSKTQLKGQIARRNDNPGDIANREFRKLLYGATSPYGRTIELATLDNISREDVVEFYKQLNPGQIILGVVGDFKINQVKGLIAQTLTDWPAAKTPVNLPQIAVTQASSNRLYTVNQPQLNQSNVLLGHLGGTMDSPDYPSLTVLNGVLSGFGGRLFNEIRSRKGLAYSVYGIWRANYNYPGVFVAGGQTRSSETVPFIEAINTEIERVRTSKITPDELSYSRDSILNSFVFNFTSPNNILTRLMTYEYFDYPSDFIFRYQKAVKLVTAEDVQRVAKKHLQPEKIVTLVVGNTENINTSLAALGKGVENIPLVVKP